MNYLAHLYLSGNNEKLLVGNFIGDYVKGKNYLNYADPIKKGILLHRQIDSFTDSHRIFHQSKQFFIADFGLYSGIVIDFIFDHFLAKNWQQFSDIGLRVFAKKVHAILLSNFKHLPPRVQGFLPFLIQNKRLESYATIEGIEKSMEIMSRFTSFPQKSGLAVILLQKHSTELEKLFFDFMNEIIEFVNEQSHSNVIHLKRLNVH
jgi:acyl carrier protein phosphodiesterase